MARVPVDPALPRYHRPLLRDTRRLAAPLDRHDQVVLLGSIATGKYVEPLLEIFGDQLWFPQEFVGRGDMSRDGLMLRCAEQRREMTYVRMNGAARRGPRPPRLARRIG